MFEKVDTRANLVHLEHEVIRFWKESDAFNTLRTIISGKPPWSFLDGPITANNPMGVHHARGRTYKDAFQRYFAMNRRDLRYQNGFDCRGLWVELEVEKELQLKTKAQVEEFGLAKFTETCKARVEKYSGIQAEQSKRLGYWMDWDNSYFTMSEENNYTIWGFLKKCHERKHIYKGTDVMPWGGRAGSAYSDMEVKEGRKLTTHTSVFVRFPLRDRKDEYLLVWTTTPWTLTSNSGAAVNGELTYVKVRAKKDGALYYFAKENTEFKRLEKEFKEGFPPFGKWPEKTPKLKTLAQIFKEQGGFEIEGELKGAEMVGWTYDGPFDDLPAQQQAGGFPLVWSDADEPGKLLDLKLIPDNQRQWKSARDGHRVIDPGKDNKGNAYVVAGEGTGIVHTAPGCGDVDHKWGEQFELVAIAPLDEAGCFATKEQSPVDGKDPFGPFSGKSATDPELVQAVLAHLKEGGFLVAAEEYPHIYPHCWRTGEELVYRLVDEWFIGMDWREEIMDTARMVNWLPPQMRGEERELNWLETMSDWMISKKRFWGLALPIWECKECHHVHVIGSRDELKEKAIEGWDEFDGNTPHRPYVDAVKIKCENAACGATVSRIPDVGNPWLDAGIVAYSTTSFNSDPDYWNKWVPADFITECFPGQFRNWFYALLSMSTMMEMARRDDAEAAGKPYEKKPPFRNLLGHAMVGDENGRAMHKSDGTAIWFEEAAEQIGVDTMRWMYCTQRPIEDLRFGLRHPDEEVTVEDSQGNPITHTVDGVRICKVTSTPADETRRRVLITLWNSYAFFTNYARTEEFDPQAKRVPVKDRPDIDRWIISELQLVVTNSREYFEKYELAPVCHRIERFIDDLSNWYIRRNRRRFYGDAGDGADKMAAHQTLFEVLDTLVRLMAPVIPFLTEEMYRNLVRSWDSDAPTSVHHTEYPVADEALIDEALSEQMNATIRMVSLGRAARTNAKIGVRQPLAEMIIATENDAIAKAADRFADQIKEELNLKTVTVQRGVADFVEFSIKPNGKTLGPKFGKQMKDVNAVINLLDAATTVPNLRGGGSIEVEVNGEMVTLVEEDFVIREQTPDHLAVNADNEVTVALDTRLTPELTREGLSRDVIRQVQDLRKKIDLQIEDRIHLRAETDDDELKAAINEHRETLMKELLATSLEMGTDTNNGDVHDLEIRKKPKVTLRVQILKA